MPASALSVPKSKAVQDEAAESTSPSRYSLELLVKMFDQMLQIRLFEEKLVEMFARGSMPGLAHLSIGEEAVPVGTCNALRMDDYITSTHRGHGHCIAKGASVDKMMAELFGKATGYCGGKGGSMHIADFEKGILGANGIVGGGTPIAAGAGLGIKMRDWIGSSAASSAMAPATRAHSMRAPTWRRFGSCRSSTSAKTTSTVFRFHRADIRLFET